MLTKKVGFIGAGNMAEAFCRGLLNKKVLEKGGLRLSDIRPAGGISWAKELRLEFAKSNSELVKWAEVVVLSVKPKDLVATRLFNLAHELQPQELIYVSKDEKRLFVSIAAGVKTGVLEGFVQGEVPFIRVMPNTPVLVGLGCGAYCLGRHALGNPATKQTIAAILGSVGTFIEVDEAKMDAVTALSGSGPAYLFLFAEALLEAGIKQGLSKEESFTLASGTLKGAVEMVAGRLDTPAHLREKVTSPNGTTAAALKVFQDRKFQEIVLEAVNAARQRSEELGRQA